MSQSQAHWFYRVQAKTKYKVEQTMCNISLSLLKNQVVVGQLVITKLIYPPKEFYHQLLYSPYLSASEITKCDLIHLP